jgi:hypothetical protein
MMLKTFVLAAAFALCSAVPALADSVCQEPIPPAAIDGNTATLEQVKAAQLDTKTFIKQSDDYQECILKEVADAKDAAKKDKKVFDTTIEDAVMAKVKANQALKERVGAEFNAAATAYNAKHPG